MSPDLALDAQITQRLLSKVRNVVTDEQHQALAGLTQLIERTNLGNFPESHWTLDQIRRQEVLLEPLSEE